MNFSAAKRFIHIDNRCDYYLDNYIWVNVMSPAPKPLLVSIELVQDRVVALKSQPNPFASHLSIKRAWVVSNQKAYALRLRQNPEVRHKGGRAILHETGEEHSLDWSADITVDVYVEVADSKNRQMYLFKQENLLVNKVH